MSEQARVFPLWLSVSVLVNILLVGLIAGYLIGRPDEGPRRGEQGSPAMMRSEIALGRGILEVTPRNERRELSQSFRRAMATSGGQLRDRLQARARLLESLNAEPFDPEAATEALQLLQDADVRLQDAAHEQIVDALGDLSPEQRAALAARISEQAAMRRGMRPRPDERRPLPPPE
ncbi:MAG: periplasmic heavy metal sensor [Pseudomonadota bacterium]